MCGIVALYNWRSHRPVEPALVEVLSEAQRHRGPDGCGSWVEGEVGLGHRRLAIVGRANGAQPLLDADGELAIVFNGEIYDHRSLRVELERQGHRFRTESDAEVVLQLYRREGDACVQRLWGDFAFALWDRRERRLLVARDPLGVKPLCWMETEDGLALASEEKALLEHPSGRRQACREAVQDYLLTGTVAPPRTFFRGIRSLPPGHLLVAGPAGIDCRRYWSVPFHERGADDLVDIGARVAERVREAVAVRLAAEVPVGAFLSGGLDSSTVVACAAPRCSHALPTYTVRYRGNAERLAGGVARDGLRGEDADYAALVARAFRTEHHEITLTTDDLVEGLDRAVWHRDRPLIHLVEHGHAHVYRAAHPKVTVMLSGEGGDEVFGGYYYWLARRTRENTSLFPWVWRSPLPVPAERAATAYDLLETGLSVELGAPQAIRRRLEQEFESAIGQADTTDFTNKLCHAFLTVRLPDFLAMEDRLGMANGMEARVPLADVRVVELVAGIPARAKLGPAGEKTLLRDHVGASLPAEVRSRVKSPFPVPLEATAFYAEALEAIRAPDARVAAYLEPQLVDRLSVKLHSQATAAAREALFRLYSLERWMRLFRVEP